MKNHSSNKQKVVKKVNFDCEPPSEIEDKPVNESLKAANQRDNVPSSHTASLSHGHLKVPLEQIEETAEGSINNRTGSVANDDLIRDFTPDNQQYNSLNSKQSKVRQTSIMDDGVFENVNDYERGPLESPSLLNGAQNHKLKERNQLINRDDSKDDSGDDSGEEQMRQYTAERALGSGQERMSKIRSGYAVAEKHDKAKKPPLKDPCKRFSQKNDPKWTCLIGLLTHNQQAEVYNELQMKELDIKKQTQGSSFSKDHIVKHVNYLFALAKFHSLKNDNIDLTKVKERLQTANQLLENFLAKSFSTEVIKHELAESTQKSELGKVIEQTRRITQKPHEKDTKMLYKDLRWVLQSFGLLASFYNSLGHQKLCEQAYVRYVQLIEQFFNGDSLETSNAYFLVGVYYFEQSMTHKSIACFRKALAIRELKFKPMHVSCSDCLLNLGILYKMRGLTDQAKQSLDRALRIRQEVIGDQSLPTASVHEELGKFFLEEEKFQESYQHFKLCYSIRKKIFSNKRVQDVERIATLLVFLHRKIELQIVNYKASYEKNSLKLLTQLGQELQNTVRGEPIGDSFDQSFSFLHRPDQDIGETQFDALTHSGDDEAGNDAGITQTTGHHQHGIVGPSQEAVGMWKEEQAERAMRNFSGVSSMGRDQQQRVERSENQRNTAAGGRTLSPDSSIDNLVREGVFNTFAVADQSIKMHYHSYAVSLLLSLSDHQMGTLQSKQLAWRKGTSDQDPLYLSNQFLSELDEIQSVLLQKSRIWLIPRKEIMEKTGTTQDNFIQERNNQHRRDNYTYMVIDRKHLIRDKKRRDQDKNDQTIFKFIQKAPEFLKSLNQSQAVLFRNVLNYNYTLRYFFLSITGEQMSIIDDLIKGKDLAAAEVENLTWIFSEFFNGKKTKQSGAMAEAIIKDQIENEAHNESQDEIDADGIREQYTNEIMLFSEELELEDFAELSPEKIGINKVFLEQELQRGHAEELCDLLESFAESCAISKKQDRGEVQSYLCDIINHCNTKILYLIYRQVKHVHKNRQKKEKERATKKKNNQHQENEYGRKSSMKGLILQSEQSQSFHSDGDFCSDEDPGQFEKSSDSQSRSHQNGPFGDTFGPDNYIDDDHNSSQNQDQRRHHYGESNYDGVQKGGKPSMKLSERVITHHMSRHSNKKSTRQGTAIGFKSSKRQQSSKIEHGYSSNKLHQVNQSAIKHIPLHESLEDSTTQQLTDIIGHNHVPSNYPFNAHIPSILQNQDRNSQLDLTSEMEDELGDFEEL